ncbi:MAG: hypothetical protein WCW62_12535, partial [Bacteroidales bacterium]
MDDLILGLGDSISPVDSLAKESDALLKALLRPSFDEMGGMFADQVRLRRFKNQIKILMKAQQILTDKGLDPKRVSLKVLAPLIEFSSYEQDPDLQGKWAELTVHILTDNEDTVFQQNCLAILNRISSTEAKLIDDLHLDLESRRANRNKKDKESFASLSERYPNNSFPIPKNPEDYSLDNFAFNVAIIAKKSGFTKSEINFRISNLISFGLLKWETNVKVNAKKAEEDPEDTTIDVNVSVSNNDIFIFTPTGDRFVKVC